MVKNDVVKKDIYDKLVAKVNGVDTSKFILKTKYDTDNQNQKTKFLILVVLLKSLKQKVKFLILVIQQQKLH